MFQCDNGSDYVSEGMYRIVDQRGRIGYADESGKTVIKPRFAFGLPFKNGKAKVTEKGTMKEVPGSGGEYHYWNSDEWYYINKKGKRIIPDKYHIYYINIHVYTQKLLIKETVP